MKIPGFMFGKVEVARYRSRICFHWPKRLFLVTENVSKLRTINQEPHKVDANRNKKRKQREDGCI